MPSSQIGSWIEIPGLNKVNADPETIRKRFGIWGEPVILGFFIGLILGILGFYNAGDFSTVLVKVLGLAMNLAAVMLLLPRMVSILMEGLIPVSEAAREFMQKRAAGREIYIGLDSAILIGHPATISASLVLVPIAILLSLILPGNRVLLFADLAVIPFVVAMFAPLMRGNIVRMIIAGTFELLVGFYIATWMAPLFTKTAVASGFAMPENALMITSIADGFIWTGPLFVTLVQYAGLFGLLILAGLLAVAMYFYLKNSTAWEIAAGAPVEEIAADTPAEKKVTI